MMTTDSAYRLVCVIPVPYGRLSQLKHALSVSQGMDSRAACPTLASHPVGRRLVAERRARLLLLLLVVAAVVAKRPCDAVAELLPLRSVSVPLAPHCPPSSTRARIGVFWSSTGIFAPYQAAAEVVFRIYTERMAARCGIGGLAIQPEFLLCDFHSDVAYAAGCSAALAAANVTAVLLSEGPTALDTGRAMAATGHYVPLLAGGSGTPSVFRNANGGRVLPQLFGVTTPARSYFSQVVSFARLQQYRTAAIVSAVDSLMAPDESVCSGAISSLIDNSLTLVYAHAIELTTGVDSMDHAYTQIRSALAEAKQAAPDVLFTCFATWCPALFQAVSDVDINPNIHATFECGNEVSTYPSIVSTATYTVSPAQFDCELIGQQYQDDPTTSFASLFPYSYDSVESGTNASLTIPVATAHNMSSSARQFCDAFDQMSNGTAMSSMTGPTMAAIYLLDYAISTTEVLDGATLVSAIQSININSFFGLLNVDRFGENGNRQIPLRQMREGVTFTVVWPPLASLIVPMPTFAQRVFAPRMFATADERTMMVCAVLLSGMCFLLAATLFARRDSAAVRSPSVLLSALVLTGVLGLAWAPATWLLVNNEATCAARVSMWLVAFGLILTPVTLQAYRVHRIRSNLHLTQPVHIQVPSLLLRAVAALLPLLLLWVLWCATDNLSAQMRITDPTRPSLNYIECTSASYVLPLLTAGGAAAYLCIPMYYAFRIRSVSGSAARLNNARLISVLLLLSLLCVCVVLALELALPNSAANVRRFKFDLMFVLSHTLGACVLVLYFFDQLNAACCERKRRQPLPVRLSLKEPVRSSLPRLPPRTRSHSVPAAYRQSAAAVQAPPADGARVSALALPLVAIHLPPTSPMRTPAAHVLATPVPSDSEHAACSSVVYPSILAPRNSLADLPTDRGPSQVRAFAMML